MVEVIGIIWQKFKEKNKLRNCLRGELLAQITTLYIEKTEP